MDRLKHHWRRTPKAVRLPVIFIIGWIVVFAGIIMLVTPGPGWVVIFLGFAILATEFASAAKVRDWLVARLRQIVDWLKYVWERIRKSFR